MSRIDGEDSTTSRRGPYVWEASTLNHWVLAVTGIHVASVVRHRSWKTRGDAKPWRVEVFGTSFITVLSGDLNEFRTLDQARAAAEKVLKKMVFNLAHAMAD